MKKLIGLFSLFAISMIISCGGNHEHGGTSQNAAAEPQSQTDVVMDEIMRFHNEAMPKMGKLQGYENLAKLRIDSLSKLDDAASIALKEDYEKLMFSLQRARKGMDDWMGEFTTDKYTDKDSLLQYYQAQKEKAEQMRNDIFTVLDSAKAKFGK